jgi:tetratricopeptide (TPR) repeat protein
MHHLPQVFITGTVEDESDLHARLTANLEKCNTEIDQRDFPPLSYKSISIDHAYVLKKNPKEYQSVDGILKYSSLQKHYDLLPSVVVMIVSFSVEWQASEWTQLNEMLFEKISRHRDQMKGRDSRVFLIAVRTGTAQIAQEVLEEKMGNMRRYLSLDNHRTFIAIALSDISAQPPNSTMRRISKSIRELSYAYYNVLEKRARFLLKTARIRGSNEGVLTARYSFKLAYFLSFQGLKLQSLKYYRQCFDALIGIVYHVDEDLVDQLKTVAEFTHYKICTMFLQSGSVRDAIAQFMTHVTTFSKVYSALAWKHYAWICDQHVVFLQLLDLYKVSNDLLTNETVDRYFFLQNALRFAIKRQQDFAKTVGGSLDVDVAEQRSRSHLLSLVVSPAKYVGAMPVLIDPVLGPDTAHTSLSLADCNNSDTKLTLRYMIESERAVDVSGFIFRLFQRSEEYLQSCSAKFIRRKANLNALLSEQLIAAGRYEQALSVLTQIVDNYRDEGWVEPSISLLRRIASCCVVLGRPEQYLAAAVTLYSQGGRAFEGAEGGEKERLNSDILSLIDCDLPYKLLPPSTIKHDPASFMTQLPVHNPENKIALVKTSPNDPPVLSKMNSFSAGDSSSHLYRKLHYGWAASPERPAAISLPLKTVVGNWRTRGLLLLGSTSLQSALLYFPSCALHSFLLALYISSAIPSSNF